MNKTKVISPIEDNKLFFLFRRGKQEHIKALFEDGEIYINTVDYIRYCDNNPERSDEDDGILHRDYYGDGKITLCDVGKDFDKDGMTMDAFNFVLKTDHKEKGNIYCLTGIYSEHLTGDRNDITFDTKSLGESTIFIQNPKKFLERLFSALEENGYKGSKRNKVVYYKNDYSGNVGFFLKHERFKPQSEYRIHVPNIKDEPIKLKIGSLKDIAVFNPGSIKLIYTDGKEQLITF